MRSQEILRIYQDVHNEDPTTSSLTPLITLNSNVRANSVSIGDMAFGDGGKGSTTQKFNERFKDKRITSLRSNGGPNAGHEVMVDNKLIVTHQLPVGVIQENVTPIMSRGMILHTRDLILEMNDVAGHFGGRLPSKPLIDGFTPLALDTHRALEIAVKKLTTGSDGSTGKAIAQGYASFYQRFAVFMDDLVDDEWEQTFRKHYQLYDSFLAGFGEEFRPMNAIVSSYDEEAGGKRNVGDADEFIYRLGQDRGILKPYVADNIYDLLDKRWKDPNHAFTIEFGQGAGLDPYHGVYPDVTASRTTSRNLPDSTYGIIDPAEIAVPAAVIKTIYMSSVGTRVLPEIPDDNETLNALRDENREFGKTTGRERPSLHISIPLLRYLRRASGDQYLIATHLDAGRENRPVQVITHYTDKVTGQELPYLPRQQNLDKLQAHAVSFEGWDGNAVKQIENPEDFPDSLKRYLAFLSRTIAPVAFGTTGPGVHDAVSWLPEGY